MSTLATVLEAPEPTTSPAARFTRLGRVGAAATLVLGGGFQLVSFLLITSASDTEDRLRWIVDHSTRAEASKVCDILAMPFLVGTAIVYVLLARERSPRLAWTGGILLGCGLLGLTAVQGFETLEYSLALDGRLDLATLADAVDDVSSAPAVAMLVLFIPPAFFGLVLSSIALWRSRAVPRGAVLLIPAFILVDFFLQMGRAGHTISFVGACWIASAILLAGRPPQRS
jgi:hypothetical protein